MKCPNCQMNINDNSEFCIHCGKSFNQIEEQIIDNNSVEKKSAFDIGKFLVKIITTMAIFFLVRYVSPNLFFFTFGRISKDNSILLIPSFYILGIIFYVIPAFVLLWSVIDLVIYTVKHNRNNPIVKNIVIAAFAIVLIGLLYVVLKYYVFF